MGTWVLYGLLAVATNTALGPPFDPVLLWYTSGRPSTQAWGFIVVGSLCAGAAAALEASVGRRFLKWRAGPSSVSRSCKGRVFYLFAAAVAASPFPFTVVRVAALSRRPRPIVYGACVAAGRLPRYALTVLAWDRLGLSGGAVGVVVAGGLIVILARSVVGNTPWRHWEWEYAEWPPIGIRYGDMGAPVELLKRGDDLPRLGQLQAQEDILELRAVDVEPDLPTCGGPCS